MLAQAELDNANQQWEETEGKATVLSNQLTNLEGQLADSQDILQEETRQKLAVQSKLRSTEEAVANLQDQLEEEEEAKKQMEGKLTAMNAQVRACFP